jgi:hypothetical protein
MWIFIKAVPVEVSGKTSIEIRAGHARGRHFRKATVSIRLENASLRNPVLLTSLVAGMLGAPKLCLVHADSR